MRDSIHKSIQELRLQGLSYKAIATALALSINSVKSYCRNHNIEPQSLATNTSSDTCPMCNKLLVQIQGHKKKKFCSTQCREKYWRIHRDEIHKKAYYSLTCKHCGSSFISYGNNKRKYCSHSCYIKDRFGESL